MISSGKSSKIILYNSKRAKRSSLENSETWTTKMNGVWCQKAEEGLRPFLEFTGQSYLNIKMAELSFDSVRHTLSIDNGYFYYLRDLGQDIREWSVKIKMGRSDDQAKSHYAVVDTGDGFYYRVWTDDKNELLIMESIPEENPNHMKIIHTRQLTDANHMLMVSSYHISNYLYKNRVV